MGSYIQGECNSDWSFFVHLDSAHTLLQEAVALPQHPWDYKLELKSSVCIIKGDTDWQLLLARAVGFPVPQLSFLPNIIYLTASLYFWDNSRNCMGKWFEDGRRRKELVL